jgi:hypothetical protein
MATRSATPLLGNSRSTKMIPAAVETADILAGFLYVP